MSKSGQYKTPVLAFCERLPQLMYELRVTRQELGGAIGVSGELIRQYIKGHAVPPIHRVVDIAEYFHVSADWLLGIESGEEDKLLVAAETLGINYADVKLLSELSAEKKADVMKLLRHICEVI